MEYQQFINSWADAIQIPDPAERAKQLIALLRTGFEAIHSNALLITQCLVDENSELPREVDASLTEIKHIAHNALSPEYSLLDALESALSEISPQSPQQSQHQPALER